MAFLKLDQVVKRFGDHEVIRGVSLTAERGEFVVFVGPSGCGKSTLLRMIAGLEDISGGDIDIDGKLVTYVEPAHRQVSMVFQSYALYPHMTVFENMAFGLRMTKAPEADIKARVEEAARILQIEALLGRKPRQLSGGQRQRVAIGRAIVRKPKLFLFDEPLSNLDADLRTQMRVEIAKLHRDLGVTMVYVTHDQVEAMTLADRIVVLRAGKVEQVGTPTELYDRPANTFVAGFIGSPKMNFVEGVVSAAAERSVDVTGEPFPGGRFTVETRGPNRVRPGDKVSIGLRPEHLALGASQPVLRLTTEFSENLGGATLVFARGANQRISIMAPGRPALKAGDQLDVGVAPANVYLFDAAGLAV